MPPPHISGPGYVRVSHLLMSFLFVCAETEDRYIFYLSKYDKSDKSSEQTIRNKTHKAQEALTAASETTNRLTYQKCFIKLVKSTFEIEQLNLDNVLKSTIFTASEFQAFTTRSLKSLLWFVRKYVLYII